MKLATIGSYGHVGYVLDGLGKVDGVDLVAAAAAEPGKPPAFASEHPAAAGATVYDDYRRMLDEVRPDVVGVFMPLYRNAEAATAAAEAGAHVVAEKPLATEPADLARLREAVAAAGVRIAALLAMRGQPPYLAARAAVAAGRLGEPLLAFGQKSYPFATRDELYKRRETYGGSIPWCAIHAIDFVSFAAGKDYTRVMATQSNAAHPSHPGMEDAGAILLDFADGGHAAITFDYLRPWPGSPGGKRSWGDERLRIVGSEAMLELADEGRRVVLTTPDGEEDLPLPPKRDLFAEFIGSLDGDGEGLISPAESFRATEVALKARDAADQGIALTL